MIKPRWSSVWHQLDEVVRLRPRNVLEVGPGPGLFKLLGDKFNLNVETLDLDPNLSADHIGSATDIPFDDNSYDVVCAFQVLEHLPYESSLQAFKEMSRVSRHNVVISLPDAKSIWRYLFFLPKLGSFEIFVPRPRMKTPSHTFDGEHYWEINKKGYSLKKVIEDFSKHGALTATYRVPEHTFHRFLIFDTSSVA